MYITTTIKDNMSIHLKVNSINTYLFQLRKRRPFTEEHNKETNRAADEVNDRDYIDKYLRKKISRTSSNFRSIQLKLRLLLTANSC